MVGRVDGGGGGVEVEVGEPLQAWEAGFVDASCAAPLGAVVELDAEDVGEEPEIGRLRPLGLGGEPVGVITDAGQVQLASRSVNRNRRCGVGRCAHLAASSSWS